MISSKRINILRRIIPLRCFHTTMVQRIDPKTVEEIKIPVPWGHIAGKWWRKSEKQPVLALHGLFDNAGTFDELVPLLNENISVLALDVPGFGRSSNPPDGMSPSYLELVFWIRHIIKNHFKWEKVSLMGHSFGSSLSFSYASMFPEQVEKFVSMDCSRFVVASRTEYLLNDLKRVYRGGMLKTIQVPYEGSYKMFLDYTYNNRKNYNLEINEKCCEILLSRDLVKIGNDLYRMPTDRRPHLKYTGRLSWPFMDALADRIRCQTLFIKPSGGLLIKFRPYLFEKQFDIMSKNSEVIVEVVEGGHHVHLEEPDKVAPVINNFLKSS